MKILVVGNSGYYVNKLFGKLLRERHQVYHLCNIKNSGTPMPKGIIETYTFPYDSTSSRLVIKDILPDVIVFAGAADSSYHWSVNPSKVAVTYTAGLLNILLSAAEHHVNKFIYISSEDVFGHGGKQIKAATDAKQPDTIKGSTIAQGESICSDYNNKSNLECFILRISSLYGEPTYYAEQSGRICDWVREAFDDVTEVPIDKTFGFYPTYVSDGVEATYQLIVKEKLNEYIYQISGEELTSSYIVKNELLNNNEIDSIKEFILLDSDFFKKEFDFKPRIQLKEGLSRCRQVIHDHRLELNIEMKKNERKSKKGIWTYIQPFAENIGLFILFILLTTLFAKSTVLNAVDLSIIYVLIIAVTFGKIQAMIASFLAILFKVALFSTEGVNFITVLTDVPVIINFLMLFVAGMIAAHCRDTLLKQKDDLHDENERLQMELEDIRFINDSNQRIKQSLEKQILNSDDSLAKIYSIVSKLDDTHPSGVMYKAIEIIKEIMKIEKVSIYSVVANGAYGRLMASSDNDNAHSSIKIEEYSDVIRSLNKGEIFVNSSLNNQHPMLAAPILLDGDLKMMLFLWDVDFEQLKPYYVNLFMILSRMITNSMITALRFNEISKDIRYIPNTTILATQAYKQVLNIVKNANKNKVVNWIELEVDMQANSIEQINEKLSPLIRNSDFIGLDENNTVHVVLINTNIKGSEIVINRINDCGLTVRVVNEV